MEWMFDDFSLSVCVEEMIDYEELYNELLS